jgi:hypothetical protein
MIKKILIYNIISLIKFDFKLWKQIHNLLVYKLIPMKFRNLKFDLDLINFNRMEKCQGCTVQSGRIQPACFGLAQLSRTEQGRLANGGTGGAQSAPACR